MALFAGIHVAAQLGLSFYCGPTYCVARVNQVNLERHLALVVYDFAVCYLTWLGPSTLCYFIIIAFYVTFVWRLWAIKAHKLRQPSGVSAVAVAFHVYFHAMPDSIKKCQKSQKCCQPGWPNKKRKNPLKGMGMPGVESVRWCAE